MRRFLCLLLLLLAPLVHAVTYVVVWNPITHRYQLVTNYNTYPGSTNVVVTNMNMYTSPLTVAIPPVSGTTTSNSWFLMYTFTNYANVTDMTGSYSFRHGSSDSIVLFLQGSANGSAWSTLAAQPISPTMGTNYVTFDAACSPFAGPYYRLGFSSYTFTNTGPVGAVLDLTLQGI